MKRASGDALTNPKPFNQLYKQENNLNLYNQECNLNSLTPDIFCELNLQFRDLLNIDILSKEFYNGTLTGSAYGFISKQLRLVTWSECRNEKNINKWNCVLSKAVVLFIGKITQSLLPNPTKIYSQFFGLMSKFPQFGAFIHSQIHWKIPKFSILVDEKNLKLKEILSTFNEKVLELDIPPKDSDEEGDLLLKVVHLSTSIKLFYKDDLEKMLFNKLFNCISLALKNGSFLTPELFYTILKKSPYYQSQMVQTLIFDMVFLSAHNKNYMFSDYVCSGTPKELLSTPKKSLDILFNELLYHINLFIEGKLNKNYNEIDLESKIILLKEALIEYEKSLPNEEYLTVKTLLAMHNDFCTKNINPSLNFYLIQNNNVIDLDSKIKILKDVIREYEKSPFLKVNTRQLAEAQKMLGEFYEIIEGTDPNKIAMTNAAFIDALLSFKNSVPLLFFQHIMTKRIDKGCIIPVNQISLANETIIENILDWKIVKIYFKNGDFYEGAAIGYKMDGMGTMHYGNGKKFIGEWKNCKPFTGKGFISFLDGTQYEGAIDKGKFEGIGVYVDKLGDIITGTWVEAKLMSGTGKLTLTGGDEYYGKIKDFKANGLGKTKNKYETFVGIFNDGVRNGEGELTIQNHQALKGTWLGMVLVKGRGQLPVNVDGTYYVGEIQNNKPCGEGTLIYPNWKQRTGIWNDGILIKGVGYLPLINGNYFEGEILNNQPSERGNYFNFAGQQILQGML